MNAGEARYQLQQVKRRYITLRTLEVLLSAAAVYLLITLAVRFIVPEHSIALLVPSLAAVTYVVHRALRLGIFRIEEKSLASYINHHYPQMEESADLLLAEDGDLTTLQQLQKRKCIQNFETLFPSIKLPHRLGLSFVIFAASVLLYIGVKFIDGRTDKLSSSPGGDKIAAKTVSPALPATIREVVITVTPPGYTGKPSSTTSNFNLDILEGTAVEWRITFTDSVSGPQLVFAGKDSTILTPASGHQYLAHRLFSSSGFYQLTWKSKDGKRKYSDYYQVEVTKDQPPVMRVDNLNQFVEFSVHEDPRVNLKASLADDFGLSDAYIIATVSKGSGESVKFREEKLRFDKPANVSGKSVTATRLIDLVKLGLDPGDELYFYVEALDNKQPLPNRSRTETFFISLQDTSAISTSVDPGLGVDLMPEYFRSQRQIIIDSEKLLKEKKKITKESFNARSNELGHDQKVLRLRYGEFLGEEFESGIGPQAEIPTGDHEDKEEDVTKKYGHVHDRENEHNLVEEKKSAGKETHSHDHDSNDPKTDPVKEYTHMHDSDEEATFFTQSIRAKLKAAITIMWDAELYLRLYEPEKSLPFQYKALKLLKEISQDSRIYVHRTGFDPPPLKEEKRLTGDLDEIVNSTDTHETSKEEMYPDIKKAAARIELLLSGDDIAISSETNDLLSKAALELSVAAIEQPGRYLKTLSLLKAVTENELEGQALRTAMIRIRSTFWYVIPPSTTSPQAKSGIRHTLDNRFLNKLKALKRNG